MGNYEWAGYGAYAFCSNAFACSPDLAVLEQEIHSYCDEVAQLHQITPANWCRIYWQSALNLMGRSEEPHVLSGDVFREEDLFSDLSAAQDFLGLFYFHLYKVILCYLFGNNRLARTHAENARQYLIVAGGTVGMPTFCFYDALSALKELETLEPDSEEYFHLLEKVNEVQGQLQQLYADHAPINYQHKVDLIEAEKSRLLGQKVKAIEQYDQAIAQAQVHQYKLDEALANELSAQFYLSWGKQKIAAVYLQDAYQGYDQWGAKAKTYDLEQRHPKLLQSRLHLQQALIPTDDATQNSSSGPSFSSLGLSNGISNPKLDFSTVLQSTQLLSEKIQVGDLLTQLANLMLYNSGADKLAIVLPDDNSWQVRAVATPETTQLLAETLAESETLPVQLIRYVKHTREAIAVDGIKSELPVLDRYLQEHRPQSLLCLPLLHQDRLVGLLYFQNQSISGVFNDARITVINLLCSQAAIALDNARLFQEQQQLASDLQVRNSFLKAQQNSSLDGILIIDANRQINSYNQPFVSIWNIPEHLLEAQDDQLLVDYVLDQLKNPTDFSARLDYLYAHPNECSHDEISLKDQRILEQYSSPVILPSGEYGGRIWSFRDISDRKRTEGLLTDYNQELEQQVQIRTQALQKSEATLLKAQQVAHVGNWEFDIASQSVTWSPELFRLCGLEPTTVAPSYPEYLEMLSAEARQLLECSVERTISKGIPYKIEYDITLADGSVRHHECRAEAEKDEQGQVLRLLGTTVDITERKQAELTLQNLVAGTAATLGEDFFPALVHHISAALDVPLALVTQFAEQEVKSLAFIVDGELQPNFTYHLPDTPCRELVVDDSFHCPSDLAQHFPKNPHVERGMDSYLGIALHNSQGQVLGSLCIFDRRPLREVERARQILKVFGSRASAELERQRAENALQTLIAGTAAFTGPDFFNALVRHIAEALNASCAIVTEVIDSNHVRTLSAWAEGEYLPHEIIDITGTPCEHLLQEKTYYCERDLVTRFPNSARLTEMEMESYQGIVLPDSQGHPIGMLCVFAHQPMVDPGHSEQILRVFAARAATELERQRAENALQNLIAGTAALTGPDFFAALSRHIAEALQASHAFVTELVEGERLHFLAAWADGKHLPNDTVELEGTTCAIALREGAYHCERDVIDCFPENPRLAPMGVESYMGVALQNSQGQALGTLCIFSRQLIANPEQSQQLLQVFAARAAAELERQRTKQAMEQLNQELELRVRDRTAQLAASEKRLRTLFNETADAVFLKSGQDIIDCNQAAVDLLRYSSKEALLALQSTQISPERQPDGQLSSVKSQAMLQEALQRGSSRFEWVHQRADGEDFWADITLTPIRYQEEVIFHCMTRDISDRKRLEQEQARLTAVLETTPDFIGIANTQGEILWQNKPLRELRADLSHSEGYRTFGNCHPDWVNKIIRDEAIPTAVEQGSWSGELALLDGKGNEIPVSQVIIAHKSASGDVENFSTVMRDISVIKQTEAALKLSEARAQATFTQAAVGFVEVSLATKQCVRANNWFCDMLGYSRTELAEMTVGEITHPDDIPTSVEAMKQLHHGEVESFTMEKRYIRKDRTLFWAETTCYMIQHQGGNDRYSVGLIQDISEKKHLEAERQRAALDLQLSEARANAAFEQAAVGIAESNLTDGKITRTNNYFCQMTGYTAKELTSLTAAELTHPDDLSDSREQIKQLYTGNINSFTLEKRYLCKDGSYFWATTAVTLIRNSAEDSPRCLAVVQDISDRKRAEVELHRTNEELIYMTRMKDEFLANMSHELRTPLNAILGMSECLKENILGETTTQQQSALETIYSSGSHLLSLINEILDLSKIQAGQIKLQLSS